VSEERRLDAAARADREGGIEEGGLAAAERSGRRACGAHV